MASVSTSWSISVKRGQVLNKQILPSPNQKHNLLEPNIYPELKTTPPHLPEQFNPLQTHIPAQPSETHFLWKISPRPRNSIHKISPRSKPSPGITGSARNTINIRDSVVEKPKRAPRLARHSIGISLKRATWLTFCTLRDGDPLLSVRPLSPMIAGVSLM